MSLLGLIPPFTVRSASVIVVPIPTLPLVKTVIAFKKFPALPIPISKMLFDNHRLYCPIAIEPVQFACVPSPIAVEYRPLACVSAPIAVEYGQSA